MDFVENLEMTHIVRGRGGRHVICVIMTITYVNRYVSHALYFNTFVTIEKMEPYNYD